MQADTITGAFCAALVVSLMVKAWLTLRQMRHVARGRAQVPADFATTIALAAHQKAADYTRAKLSFGLAVEAISAAVLIAWTLLGGLDALNRWVLQTVPAHWGSLAYQLALVAAFALIGTLVDAPLDAWRTFKLEQRFGFNRMTPGLFVADLLKGLGLSFAIGAPLLALVLWLMQLTGSWWWLAAWGVFVGFSLLMQFIYPLWIAPLFNQFKPLADEALAKRVQGLMQRCGFQAKGFFVMDGSRRSAHGNAYFAGLGKAKRVVFFDTLLERLAPQEVEAVLAHELGHFHHKHVLQRMLALLALSFVGLALLGWLSGQTAFYEGLGVTPNAFAPNHALALLLFTLAAPPFMYFIAPAVAWMSRKAEFEADAYASSHTSGADLRSALLKLYEDNASTLTPDPVYVRFYYSHPPASERLTALARLSAAARPAE